MTYPQNVLPISSDADRAPRKYECCRQLSNLTCVRTDVDKCYEQCVCGRKHYILIADAIDVLQAGKVA